MGGLEPRTSPRISYSKLLSLFMFPIQITHDYVDLAKCGVFQAYCYKKAYLNELTTNLIALLHYLLIGSIEDIHRMPFLIRNITAAHEHEIGNRRLLRSI